ncbi:MAG: hypothetical protein FWC36_08200 [Spirochaetes bacterium]|nr:hypothetical protein [Spirochaetota bacterium]
MKKIAAVVLFFFVAFPAFSGGDIFRDLIPEEYSADEFPQFLRDIRRATIILTGSYPFTILFARIGMDGYDFVSSGFDSRYAPPMFGGAHDVQRSSSNIERVLLTALCLSAGVALLDFIIGRSKARGRRQSANNQTVHNRQFQPPGNGTQAGSGTANGGGTEFEYGAEYGNTD